MRLIITDRMFANPALFVWLHAALFTCVNIVKSSGSINDYNELVFHLSEENFTTTLKQYEAVVVNFYAPRCQKCDALLPEYMKVAQRLNSDDSKRSRIRLATVNAKTNSKLLQGKKVGRYPSLFLYVGGQSLTPVYLGELNSEGILKWLEDKFFAPVHQIVDVETAKIFVTTRNVSVIGFYKHLTSPEAKAFKAVGAQLSDKFTLGMTSEPQVFKHFKILTSKTSELSGTIIMFKKNGLKTDVYGGSLMDVNAMVQFIRVHSQSLVLEYPWDGGHSHSLFLNDVKTTLFAFLRRSSPQLDNHLKLLKSAAKKYQERCTFAWVDADNVEASKRLMKLFFFRDDTPVPTVRVASLVNDESKKFEPEDPSDFSLNGIMSTVEGVLSGQLPQVFPSEDLPSDWDTHPVKVLVGRNFHRVVRDRTKAVFVKVYSPSCVHCVRLAPAWEKLAAVFKARPDVIIAKMNGMENKVDGVDVNSFPTLLFYPKSAHKQVIEYKGGRSLEQLTAFVQSNLHVKEEL